MRLPLYLKGIQEIEKQLDPVNVTILSAMWKFGPRNLLEVSRRTDLPFTTVYHRVGKLEARSKRIVYLMPQTHALGLTRVVVPVVARMGYEELVAKALRIPNLWRSINRCEGPFTHISTHSVPVGSLSEFKKYISHLSKSGLITDFKFILTGDPIPNFPDFTCYDAKIKQWSFRWDHWTNGVKAMRPTKTEDPTDYQLRADYRDILIVKELQTNGRISFAELAPLLGISLQAVKYRYDRLVSSGIVKHFQFDVYAFPVEISACHELMIQFTSDKAMNKFLAFVSKLFFVAAVAKVLKENTLVIRTYLPQSQVGNMFGFFSALANAGLLTSYSAVRLDLATRQTQTISFELFDDKKGWVFDLKKCLIEAQTLTKGKGPIISSAKTLKSE